MLDLVIGIALLIKFCSNWFITRGYQVASVYLLWHLSSMIPIEFGVWR
jgi:hypothetical protein